MASVAASVARLTHPSSQTALGSPTVRGTSEAQTQSTSSLLCVSSTARPRLTPLRLCASAPLRHLLPLRPLPVQLNGHASLADTLARETREGELYERAARRPAALLRVRPLLSAARGRASASARCASTRAAGCGCRGATSAACSAIRSRRSRSSTRIPARWPTASGCSAATCTAAYCQNWVTSQALRDPAAVAPPLAASPEALVARRAPPGRARDRQHLQRAADHERMGGRRLQGSQGRRARRPASCRTATGRREVLEYLRPWVDLYKVDLKSFDDRHYRQLGGRLEPILDTIRRLHAMGFWVEIVTLLIPGFNDSRDELTRLTEFVAGVSPDIPWHVTAFHGDYKMTDPENTTAEMLLAAADIGRANGPALRVRRQPARARSATSRTRTARRAASCSSRRYGYLHPRIPPDARRPLPRAARRRCPGRWSRALRRPDCVAARSCRAPGSRLEGALVVTRPMNFRGSCCTTRSARPLRNLRLSVTDRCNLRCEYCMPEDGLRLAAARGRPALRGDQHARRRLPVARRGQGPAHRRRAAAAARPAGAGRACCRRSRA